MERLADGGPAPGLVRRRVMQDLASCFRKLPSHDGDVKRSSHISMEGAGPARTGHTGPGGVTLRAVRSSRPGKRHHERTIATTPPPPARDPRAAIMTGVVFLTEYRREPARLLMLLRRSAAADRLAFTRLYHALAPD